MILPGAALRVITLQSGCQTLVILRLLPGKVPLPAVMLLHTAELVSPSTRTDSKFPRQVERVTSSVRIEIIPAGSVTVRVIGTSCVARTATTASDLRLIRQAGNTSNQQLHLAMTNYLEVRSR